MKYTAFMSWTTKTVALAGLLLAIAFSFPATVSAQSSDASKPQVFTGSLEKEFANPPRLFSLMPFWFWNDELTQKEIVRQIIDFEQHGVYGFTIHPRIGLPKDCGWLSPKMIAMMHVAIKEASQRGMHVMLYDDGMYPSGSSSGQVVAENADYAARGLYCVELKNNEPLPKIDAKTKLVTVCKRPNGNRVAVYEGFSGGHIRGLHFVGPENVKSPREDLPAAADLLNPEAVRCFIRLVYQRFYDEFRPYFNDGTIVGIFTDEPSILGRGGKRGMVAGNTIALPKINKILGYDFTPYLCDLWYSDRPDSKEKREQWERAVSEVLEETYYKTISDWCTSHHVALAGHPALSSDLGLLRRMHIPGQDIVWRYIEPGEKAFSPEHSMMGKVASSAMIHAERRRNLNEVYGAFGHNLTFDEMKWLAGWCFVRGHNMLLPHAFYYSIRGPRFEERPPDVGPNAAWWGQFKPFADFCSRLSWLNTDSKLTAHVCVLAPSHKAGTEGTRPLYENQIDFNYLELRDLYDRAEVDRNGVKLGGMHYTVVVLPPVDEIPAKAMPALQTLAQAGRLIRYTDAAPGVEKALTAKDDADYIKLLRKSLTADVTLQPAASGIRVRHITKGTKDFYILFNEVESEVKTTIGLNQDGKRSWWDPYTGTISPAAKKDVSFKPHELKILCVE